MKVTCSISNGKSPSGTVQVLDKNLKVMKEFIGSEEETYAINVAGSTVVCGGEDAKLRFYDLELNSNQPLKVFFLVIFQTFTLFRFVLNMMTISGVLQ